MSEKHLKQLTAGLGAPPEEFEYRGECVDRGKGNLGTCACGHMIRFEFTVHHKKTGDPFPIGSTCINFFATADAAAMKKDERSLIEKFNKDMAAIREFHRIEERHAAETEAQKVLNEYMILYQSLVEAGTRMPILRHRARYYGKILALRGDIPRIRIPKYKQTKRITNFLNDFITEYTAEIGWLKELKGLN